MSSKLDCPDTTPKTCWSIINRFLNKEESLLVNRNDASVQIKQSCGKSIALPLTLFFKKILEEGTFPEDWKKVMLYHFTKKSPRI